MKRILQTVSVLAFVLISVGNAQAIPLVTLLAGGSITAGDKLFDKWSLIQFISSDPSRTFNAGNIDVTALNDGNLNPGPGLQFTVNNKEMSVTGDGVFNFIDLAFGFHVSASPGFRIKDNSLNLDGTLSTTSANGFEDLGMTIQEWVGNALVTDPATPGFISSEVSALNGVNTTTGLASSIFAPRADLFVTKDILIWATNKEETASLLNFNQRFSQVKTVPEPGTLTLLVLTLAVLGVGRLRRN